MYITVDDIENEITFNYPTDNRNGNKKVGPIRAYFFFRFYVENDEKIHLEMVENYQLKNAVIL